MTILSSCVACAVMLVGAQATSVKSWADVKIIMDGSGDKEEDSVFLYSISVTSGGEEWACYHRYSDFGALKKTLGAEADVIATAPFPGKYYWPFPTDSMKAERRKGLENWLQQVAARAANVIDSWKVPLNEFLKKDSEIGVYGRDQWMQLVTSVNENAQTGWATTASKLQEWYDNGVATCESDENCKALSGKLADMKSGVAETLKNIGTKTEEMKERMKEAMALNDEAEKAEVDLEKVKDSGKSNAEEVKVAEAKLKKAKTKATKKMKEVKNLKEDVQELEQNAKATMEKSFENTMASTEL